MLLNELWLKAAPANQRSCLGRMQPPRPPEVHWDEVTTTDQSLIRTLEVRAQIRARGPPAAKPCPFRRLRAFRPDPSLQESLAAAPWTSASGDRSRSRSRSSRRSAREGRAQHEKEERAQRQKKTEGSQKAGATSKAGGAQQAQPQTQQKGPAREGRGSQRGQQKGSQKKTGKTGSLSPRDDDEQLVAYLSTQHRKWQG